MARPDGLDRLAASVLLVGGGSDDVDDLRALVGAGAGGVLAFGPDTDGVQAVATGVRGERRDVLVAVDEEGGPVTRLERRCGSSHPGHLALGAVGDVGLTRRVAASVGALVAAAGADWSLAPVADVTSVPVNPAVAPRTFGTDPAAVADQVAAYVAGLQDDAGVLACVKHFPGHGGSAADSHVRRAYVHGGAERLDRELLPPFRAAIDAGVASVMLGHVVVTALDPWRPASTSRAAVGLLRRDLGFVGLVVTDALGMAGATAAREVPAAAVRAIAAGADMVCLDLRQEPGAADAVVAAIRAAVRAGRLRESRLREAAGKVADAGRRRDAMAASNRGAVPDPVACREVARRVLQVEGDVRLRGGRAPVVVTADARPPAVAADVAWGVGATLRSAAPGTTLRRVGPSSAASFPFGDDPDRELVLVVRDAGVDPWQVALVDRALGLRPGAVLVELGVPAGTGLSAARRVRTPDVSAVSAAAVVDLLLDQG